MTFQNLQLHVRCALIRGILVPAMFTRHVYTACLPRKFDLSWMCGLPKRVAWVIAVDFELVSSCKCLHLCWLVRWGPLLIACCLLFLFSPPSFSSWLSPSLPSCPLFFLSLLVSSCLTVVLSSIHVRCALIRGEIESRHESKPNAAGPRAFQGKCICHDWRTVPASVLSRSAWTLCCVAGMRGVAVPGH